MGFTDVARESRSTERLAADLTAGPGPGSIGQAGAAWVRVATEMAFVADEYGDVVERIKAAFVSQGADAVVGKLEDFGGWLQAVSLSAAANGERSEDAAVANGVAIRGMPSVSEAVEDRAAHDVMNSLAAYNGAILNGRFAELDDAATDKQANAATVMYQYEESCDALAAPWEQAPAPDVCTGAALTTEKQSKPADRASDGAATPAARAAVAVPPTPLTAFRPKSVKSSVEKTLKQSAGGGIGHVGSSVGAAGGMGAGYGPMAALGRGGGHREYESNLPAGTLDGGGESGAGLSDSGGTWLPTAKQSEDAFTVSSVSWGPGTSTFDELATPDQPEIPAYDDEPQPTLEHVSNRWVAPAVIGADKGLRL